MVSPVRIRKTRVQVADEWRGYRDKVWEQRIEIVSRETGEALAVCHIGDEALTERIADLLSEKGLRREADQFRAMVADDRRGRLQPERRGVVARMLGL